MQSIQLPLPPDPDAVIYKGNPTAWMKAMYQYLSQVKSHIETDSRTKATPVGPFVVSTYTAVSTVTGTDALSNFVASLVTAMNVKGITSPNIKRTGS